MGFAVTAHESGSTATLSVLVTGATGYIGGRLVPVLERTRPASLSGAAPGGAGVSRVADDRSRRRGPLDPASLDGALAGIDVAYYLVHSMGAHGDYRDKDRVAARNFGEAARRAGVRRIVYLGGLATGDEALSTHLHSRLETGQMLRESGVPVVEFRASVVIGSGSLSFELIRALVERLPVMICPRWVGTLAQPIGIDDVLAYLAAALDLPDGESHTFEIGGADRASYGDVMREYARQRGLKRVMISVPLLTPRLSSLWLGLVTPVYARVGRELIAGLKNRSVVTDPAALSVFPIGRRPARSDRSRHPLRGSRVRADPVVGCTLLGRSEAVAGRHRFGGKLMNDADARGGRRRPRVCADRGDRGRARLVFRYVAVADQRRDRPAGRRRGMRRGRRDPNTPAVGDALDFWRVEAFERGRRVRLAAEMKLPGRAWLEFEVVPAPGGAVVHQTAVFEPVGFPGCSTGSALTGPRRDIRRLAARDRPARC